MRKVSVVILNYNGGELVLQCLRSALALSWPDLEIIVVDNASTDGSPARIAQEFGKRVRLLLREINSPTAGRNQGFAAATGDYVLSLDNDIVLPDPSVLHRAIAILDRMPAVGALNFKIADAEHPDEPLPEHWWYPVPLREASQQFFYSDWFAEGAVIFRREVLVATQGYDADFVHGFESVDLALRLLDKGFDILYCPTLRSIELRVRGWQYVKPGRINYLTLRNKLWTAWKDYPPARGLIFGLTRIAAAGFRALRYGWLKLWFRAVVEGVFAPRCIRDKRRSITPATWSRIRRIHKGQFCPEAAHIATPDLTSTRSTTLA